MNEIQDFYAMHSFQGYKRITQDLNDLGYIVNHKWVYRLMQIMGIQAVYPKKNLSKRRLEDSVYPYQLKNIHLKKYTCWCVDITYIKTSRGHVYLTALIDVVSRYVVGWSLNTFGYFRMFGCSGNGVSKGFDSNDHQLRSGVSVYEPRMVIFAVITTDTH